MADEEAKKWVNSQFGAVDDETADRLLSVKEIFNYSRDDLYIQWEAFVVTQQDGELDITAANVEKFQEWAQNRLNNDSAKKTPAVKKTMDGKRRPVMRSNVELSSSPGAGFGMPSTPRFKKQKIEPVSDTTLASSPSHFATANNTVLSLSSKKPETDLLYESNTVLECLNPTIEASELNDHPPRLSANFDPEKFKFRTMAMKLLESADVLDDQIDLFSQKFSTALKDKGIELGNPCMNSQFDIACCGRIVPDSPYYDSMITQTLNDKSLYLETSRLGGIGQRVPLDLSNLQEYSFFPGQIVGLKGRNPTGRAFLVHEVLTLPELGTPVTHVAELQDIKEASNGESQKLVIACGPFSNHHNLNFTKLENFVQHLNNVVKPHVAVIFGPLLDITNAAVASGEVEVPGLPSNQQPRDLDELLRATVTPILKKIDSNIQVILVPSLRDAVNKHTSYPQSAFDRKKLGLPKNFKCFPNPSTFSINEVVISASNADLFKDLKDVYKSNVSPEKSLLFSNRFERIANHVFEQRRFYPIFPGSVKRQAVTKEEKDKAVGLTDGAAAEDLVETHVGGSSLEVPYLGLAEIGDSLPDVMVIPSELKFFAKVIKGVIVINPGQFVRAHKDPSKEDGSYVLMSVSPPDIEGEDNVEPVEGSNGLYYNNVYKRSRVEILRS